MRINPDENTTKKIMPRYDLPDEQREIFKIANEKYNEYAKLEKELERKQKTAQLSIEEEKILKHYSDKAKEYYDKINLIGDMLQKKRFEMYPEYAGGKRKTKKRLTKRKTRRNKTNKRKTK